MLRMNCSSMFRSSPAIRAKSSRAKITLAKAIDYMLKRWDGFARFLDDGRICLINNAAHTDNRIMPRSDRNPLVRLTTGPDLAA